MYLPEYLLTFLKCIFVRQTIDCEIASIGHAIIHVVHPIALIQLCLRVQLRHHFESRLLIFT